MSELIGGTINGAPLTRRAARRVLRAARRGRQRDHAQCDQRRPARLLRAPRRVGEARASIRSCSRTRSRRSCAGSSPISHFTRVATEDCEVRGVAIRAGDQLALYFGSANRDEDVFDDPFAFRVDRRPNPHLAFGFGEHFCMGAHLARVGARDDLPASARAPGRVRAVGVGGATRVRRQRQHQAPTTALPLGVARDPRGDTMEHRPFGKTGLDVSAIGYGCWEIGGGYGDIEEEDFRRAGRPLARPRCQLLRHRRGLRHGRVGARARPGARSAGATRRSSSPSSA